MNENTILLVMGIILLAYSFDKSHNLLSKRFDFGKLGVSLIFLYNWAYSVFDFKAIAQSGDYSIKDIIFISNVSTYVVYFMGLILLLLQSYICYRDAQ